MKWPFRKQHPPELIPINVRIEGSRDNYATIKVDHTITHKPHPRPTRFWFIITNEMGYRWQSTPSQIYGKTSMPINLPVEWITGNKDEHSQVQITMELEYDERNM